MELTPSTSMNGLYGNGPSLSFSHPDHMGRAAGGASPASEGMPKDAVSEGSSDPNAKKSAAEVGNSSGTALWDMKTEKIKGAGASDAALTEGEKREVRELRQRDREVRAHEQAHRSAGAGLVRGGSYEYATGPDGRRYVVAGEVRIDTSKEKDPRATLRKMEQVKRAALAPAEPSAADKAVAAQADRIAAEARAELAEERMASLRGESDGAGEGITASQADDGVETLGGASEIGANGRSNPGESGSSTYTASATLVGSRDDDPFIDLLA